MRFIRKLKTEHRKLRECGYDANKNPTSETRSGVMAPYSWSTGPTGYDAEDRLVNWHRTNGDSQTWNLNPLHFPSRC
jgi:hypothetical protein